MTINFFSFLKKISTINDKFIDDFSKLFTEESLKLDANFIIDYRLLIKWLKLKSKKTFVETLKNSYKINIDYIIDKNKNENSHGGNNKKIYILTSDAAKRFCLMTKSSKGDEIRSYFIEVEKTLFKYQDYIIKGLEDKIKKLENNQKPKINPKKGIIYVLRSLNDTQSLYKIGRSVNLKKRLSSHNAGLGDDLELIMVYEAENIIELEKCMKLMMKKAQYRKYKEIYQVDINIIKKVIKDCDTKITEINHAIDSRNKQKQKGGTKLPKKLITNEDKLFVYLSLE